MKKLNELTRAQRTHINTTLVLMISGVITSLMFVFPAFFKYLAELALVCAFVVVACFFLWNVARLVYNLVFDFMERYTK